MSNKVYNSSHWQVVQHTTYKVDGYTFTEPNDAQDYMSYTPTISQLQKYVNKLESGLNVNYPFLGCSGPKPTKVNKKNYFQYKHMAFLRIKELKNEMYRSLPEKLEELGYF